MPGLLPRRLTGCGFAGTQALIDYISGHPNNTASRVWPVVTPRFIPACTDATLEGLGTMARDCGCHVQTHCSESDWEHAYVLSRHGMTDAMSLDRFGLLTRRSMLAHANLLTADDMDLIKLRQAAVAHCPLSNGYFAGAVFPLRAALEKGLHVGLGSDISGGPSASLFDNMRAAILVSRMLETGVDPGLPRTSAQAVPRPASTFATPSTSPPLAAARHWICPSANLPRAIASMPS